MSLKGRSRGRNGLKPKAGQAAKISPTITEMGDLIDPELFGNEAGDDEDIEILSSYFLDKPEFFKFYSPETKLAFVRSRKGVGKSALLKKTLYNRLESSSEELCIYVKASDLIALQDVKHDTPDEYVFGWQQRICTQINRELGGALRLGFTDDTIALIESAELSGFRNRNLVGALVDRLQVKGLGAEIERRRVIDGEAQVLLQRVLDKKEIRVWLFVDDVDATFVNTESERLKASTFFSACRNLVSSTRGLCIRAAVRTDVWSVLAQYDEALDKCEQYMLDLSWSTAESGRILANKIHSFFRRRYPSEVEFAALDPEVSGNEIRQRIFREPFFWAGRPLESFRPIHILSAGRPRWAAQLCKMAAKDAFSKKTGHISLGHIRSVLRDYGAFRVNDLYKEHRHQCVMLQDIIESFSNGAQRYTTDELLDYIFEKIIKRIGTPKIDGISADRGNLAVAKFLFRCGFIAARDESDPTGLGFVRYEDRPNLLSSEANLDDGLDWEIHPSYRDVLRIRRREGQDLGSIDEA